MARKNERCGVSRVLLVLFFVVSCAAFVDQAGHAQQTSAPSPTVSSLISGKPAPLSGILPVVVTAVGGNPEMVRDGIDGLLVPRGDAESVAAALLRLLDNSALAVDMGAAGRSRVEQRYQLGQTVENYWRLYQRLCPRRG